ncbi:unnamed protein product [Urochloa humidicola]
MANMSPPRRQSYDLGNGVIYTLSPSPQKAAGDSRSARFAVVASGSRPKNAPPMENLGPEEMLDLGDAEAGSDGDLSSLVDQIESLGVPDAPANIETLLDANTAGSSSLAGASNEGTAKQPADDDRSDQMSLSERARQLKGKDVVPAPEQPRTSTEAIPLVAPPAEMEKSVEKGVEKGAVALMERLRKLKAKTASYVSGLVSDGPRFVVSSVRSVEDGSANPPSLALPMGSFDEVRSARIIRGDLADLHELLRDTTSDGLETAETLRKLMAAWATAYPSPLPADLESLMARMEALAQRLEHGSTFEEGILGKEEADARSHLQRLDAACSEVAAEFEPVEGGRAELVNHSQRATSMREKQASKIAEYELKVKEYAQKVTAAQKREEELQRLEGLALENLDAFDKDV